MREAGGIRLKAQYEVYGAVQECLEASGLPSHALGEVLPTDRARLSMSRRTPVGVVAVIAPFNMPLKLASRSVAPALALGNAVILKPDPRTPVSGGVVIARVFEEAGLPAGVLHVLPGGGELGSAMVAHPDVNAEPSSDRKSTRLNSSHQIISYAVFCLKKKTAGHRAAHEHHCRLACAAAALVA